MEEWRNMEILAILEMPGMWKDKEQLETTRRRTG